MKSLGMAYAIKKKAQKKASGGMVENEDLNPMHEPEHSAKDLMGKELDLSAKAQSHGQVPHPTEGEDEKVMPKKEDLPQNMADGGNVVDSQKAKDFRKSFGGVHNSDSSMPGLAKGGDIADNIMAMRKAKKMAEGGELPESEDYLALNDSYPDPTDKETEMEDPDDFYNQMQGGVDADPKEMKKKRMASIFNSMLDDEE